MPDLHPRIPREIGIEISRLEIACYELAEATTPEETHRAAKKVAAQRGVLVAAIGAARAPAPLPAGRPITLGAPGGASRTPLVADIAADDTEGGDHA